ncbi:metal-binding protein [Pseudomonas sp. SDI]|uniref:UPF0149 family protein n=1 Tax=Pseudomonas sp. SDI TaxID=2170734 RepID=UPI000DE7972E|nr:UPF0149 family protein [Pseudomonas sp. SDI]PWB32899.1 metal-binding protein [Pseudomonas sp. SDI]
MDTVFLHPLSDKEMTRLDDLLFKYGSDKAIRTLSELDGFFVALVSSAEFIDPSDWLHVIGGRTQKLKREAEEEAFYALLMRYMNSVANDLFEACDAFEPLFVASPTSMQPLVMVEDWCSGYMRGVRLSGWSGIGAGLSKELAVIATHGLKEHQANVASMSVEQYNASIEAITEAMRSLYRHSLSLRTE